MENKQHKQSLFQVKYICQSVITFHLQPKAFVVNDLNFPPTVPLASKSGMTDIVPQAMAGWVLGQVRNGKKWQYLH